MEPISIEKIKERVHPHDIADLEKVIEHSFVAPGFYKNVHRIIYDDGTIKHVNQQFESVANGNGKVIKMLGFVQDITDQVRTDIILDTINKVCFELDNDFKVVYANKKAYAFWNKTVDEIIGKKNVGSISRKGRHANL